MADQKISELNAADDIDAADLVPIVKSGANFKATFTQVVTFLTTALASIFQASDGDLTAIAALSPSNDDIIQRKAGAWTNRTIAQLRTDLAAGYVLAKSGVQASHTGDTAEHTFATVQLPAGALGANGHFIVEAQFSCTSSANTKTPRVKLASTNIVAVALTTSASGNYRNRVANRNAQNSQVFFAAALSTHFGNTSVAIGTSAVDTSANQDITFTGQLTNSGETIALESYMIRVFPGA